LKLNAAQSAVYLASTLIGFADPKLGKQIGGVGQAAIQVYQAVNQAIPAIAKAGDALTSALSTVVMTGNVLSAVMNFVPLFVDMGPTPDEMILNQINRLSEQVDALGHTMNDRFDRVDSELGAIYSTLTNGLGTIATQLNKIDDGIKTLRAGQIEFDRSLHQFESNLYEVVADAAGRELWVEINKSIGYREATGGQVMPFSQYFDHSSFFYTWAVNAAFDSVATGPSTRDYDEAAFTRELARPFEQNLNYLANLADRWGVPSIRPAAGKLPNPEQWALGALAYAQLASEWPAYARRVTKRRTDEIIAAGELVRAASRRVATNRALFDHAFTAYRSHIDPCWHGFTACKQHFVSKSASIPSAQPISPLRLSQASRSPE
jgi:X-X-X-Leu-X-X-Gly heptad repeat protein